MTNSPKSDVGERRALDGKGRPFRSVVTAFGVFYLAAALLNGRHLHEDAKKREYGPVRDLWVAATRPLNDLSVFLGLDHFREGVEHLRKDEP
jgi:hypothetical protein